MSMRNGKKDAMMIPARIARGRGCGNERGGMISYFQHKACSTGLQHLARLNKNIYYHLEDDSEGIYGRCSLSGSTLSKSLGVIFQNGLVVKISISIYESGIEGDLANKQLPSGIYKKRAGPCK
jgi:hypothetical protein